MFSKPTVEQAYALAAVFQTCNLVSQLAHTGETKNELMEFAMSTLLNQNPSSIEALYGSKESLTEGINTMKMFFSDKQNRTPTSEDNALVSKEVVSYVMSTIHLASKLDKNPTLLERISKGIEDASIQAQHFSITHENVYSNVASLYQDTISKMRLRIQVLGSGIYLQQNTVASRIRCMLFSAIRNAYLWRQLGGKRRHLLLHRKLVLQQLEHD